VQRIAHALADISGLTLAIPDGRLERGDILTVSPFAAARLPKFDASYNTGTATAFAGRHRQIRSCVGYIIVTPEPNFR